MEELSKRCRNIRTAFFLTLFAIPLINKPIFDFLPTGVTLLIIFYVVIIFMLSGPQCFLIYVFELLASAWKALKSLRLLSFSNLVSSSNDSRLSISTAGVVKLTGLTKQLPDCSSKIHDDDVLWQHITIEKVSAFGMLSKLLYEEEWAQSFIISDNGDEALVLPLAGQFIPRHKKLYSGILSSSTIPLSDDIRNSFHPYTNVRITKEYIPTGKNTLILGNLSFIEIDGITRQQNSVTRKHFYDELNMHLAEHFGDKIQKTEIASFHDAINNYLDVPNNNNRGTNLLRLITPPNMRGDRLIISGLTEKDTNKELRIRAIIPMTEFLLIVLGFLFFIASMNPGLLSGYWLFQ